MEKEQKNPHWKVLLDFLFLWCSIPRNYQGKVVLELNVSQGGVTDAKITKTERL